MQCAVCSSRNIAGATFCAQCGANMSWEDDPHLLPLGTLLNGVAYVIQDCVGHGGFGITYAATDRKLRRKVAIKEFFPMGCARAGVTVKPSGGWDAVAYQDALSRFLLEGEALARFDHPGIVHVLGCFEENDTAYLVMELLQGKTLEQLLEERGGRLPVPEALICTMKLGAALEVVHGAGILHRDIKPGNVMVVGGEPFTEETRVVLVDFGAAREFVSGVIQTHSVMLTRGYAPFEQYAMRAPRGTHTDVYALAALLYDMLTGAPPPDPYDRLYKDNALDLCAVRPEVSEPLSKAIMRALEVRPEARTQTVREFLGELGSAPVLVAPRSGEAPPGDSETSPPGTRPQPASASFPSAVSEDLAKASPSPPLSPGSQDPVDAAKAPRSPSASPGSQDPVDVAKAPPSPSASPGSQDLVDVAKAAPSPSASPGSQDPVDVGKAPPSSPASPRSRDRVAVKESPPASPRLPSLPVSPGVQNRTELRESSASGSRPRSSAGSRRGRDTAEDREAPTPPPVASAGTASSSSTGSREATAPPAAPPAAPPDVVVASGAQGPAGKRRAVPRVPSIPTMRVERVPGGDVGSSRLQEVEASEALDRWHHQQSPPGAGRKKWTLLALVSVVALCALALLGYRQWRAAGAVSRRSPAVAATARPSRIPTPAMPAEARSKSPSDAVALNGEIRILTPMDGVSVTLDSSNKTWRWTGREVPEELLPADSDTETSGATRICLKPGTYAIRLTRRPHFHDIVRGTPTAPLKLEAGKPWDIDESWVERPSLVVVTDREASVVVDGKVVGTTQSAGGDYRYVIRDLDVKTYTVTARAPDCQDVPARTVRIAEKGQQPDPIAIVLKDIPRPVYVPPVARPAEPAAPEPVRPAEHKTPVPVRPAEHKTPAPPRPAEHKTPAPPRPAEHKTPAPPRPAEHKTPAPARPAEHKTPAPARPAEHKTPAPATPGGSERPDSF